MPRQTSFQMTEATERQMNDLKVAGFGTTTDVIRIAIDRMYQQERKIIAGTVGNVIHDLDTDAEDA